MTKLPILSSKKVIKALQAAGFEDAPKKGKGSHTFPPAHMRLCLSKQSGEPVHGAQLNQ